MSNVIEFKPRERIVEIGEIHHLYRDIQKEVIKDLRAKIKRERFEANCCMSILGATIILMMIVLG
jgi:hypothetical protein